jgi:hypothetical protein
LSFSLFEHAKPQRQWRAQPRGMRAVIGEVVAGLGVYQHRKAVAIKHQPRHEGAEYFGGKGDLKHRLGMRRDELIVPSSKLRLRKSAGDAFAQPFAAGAGRRRIVVDMSVKLRDWRTVHGRFRKH